ncbi:MAG: thioredoxin family protein [Gammaproteobacteria bacterium]|nr:thioredoxin family protein [Gammaproteobacteria bacterium]
MSALPARRFWLAALLALAATAATAAPSAGPYTNRRFQALQDENALILVAVTGPGCPACRAQRAILDSFQKQHPEADLKILWVDYDHQKRVLKYLNASLAGTLILFRGAERLWSTVSKMDEDAIIEPILRAAAR